MIDPERDAPGDVPDHQHVEEQETPEAKVFPLPSTRVISKYRPTAGADALETATLEPSFTLLQTHLTT